MKRWRPESIQSILLISVPAIGDALLATPLLSTLKKAYPHAEIDVLVPEECLGILHGNSCIRERIPFKRKSKIHKNGPLYRRLFRKYDLAVSNSIGDRYYWYQFIAARYRAALVPEYSLASSWKYLFSTVTAPYHQNEHAILKNSRIAKAIGIEPRYDVEVPSCSTALSTVLEKISLSETGQRMALLHPRPGGEYKEWPKESWAEVLRYLRDAGIVPILSGGPGNAEREFVADIIDLAGVEAVNAAGTFSFSELVVLLRAVSLFIGTDTSTTHLAAAAGTPTLALFGPTSLETWSPWPQYKDGVSYVSRDGMKLFEDRPGIQRIGNVVAASELCSCRPYYKRCRTTGTSKSDCMRMLAVPSVIRQIEELLTE